MIVDQPLPLDPRPLAPLSSCRSSRTHLVLQSLMLLLCLPILLPTCSSSSQGGGARTAERRPAARGPSHSSTRPHTPREVSHAAALAPTESRWRKTCCIFNTCVVLPSAGEKRISAAASELQPLDCSSTSSSSGGTGGGGSSNSNGSCTSSCSSSAGGGCGGKGRNSRLSLTSNDGEPEGRPTRPTSL